MIYLITSPFIFGLPILPLPVPEILLYQQVHNYLLPNLHHFKEKQVADHQSAVPQQIFDSSKIQDERFGASSQTYPDGGHHVHSGSEGWLLPHKYMYFSRNSWSFIISFFDKSLSFVRFSFYNCCFNVFSCIICK